jgi:Protein of unknown function (DUF551)
MSNWHKVTDRLPKHKDVVQVYTSLDIQAVTIFIDNDMAAESLRKNGVIIPEHEMKGYSFCSQETPGNILNGVTHWQYLPRSP